MRFVQFMKNRAYHQSIKCSPYEAMFGQPVKVGLKASNLPGEAIQSLRSEEDLEGILSLNVSGSREEDMNETQGDEDHGDDQENKDNEQNKEDEDADGNGEDDGHLEESEDV